MSLKPKPYQPERDSRDQSPEKPATITKKEKISTGGMPVRNKLLIFLITIVGLVIIGLFLVYLNGGDINILADRAEYISKDPGKAASNLYEHGNVKGESGRVCGIVRNQYNSIISGAKVQITGGKIDWSTQTDRSGQFCIPPLDSQAQTILGEVLVGDYELRTSASGYNPETKSLTVNSGEKKEINFHLSYSKDKMLPGI